MSCSRRRPRRIRKKRSLSTEPGETWNKVWLEEGRPDLQPLVITIDFSPVCRVSVQLQPDGQICISKNSSKNKHKRKTNVRLPERNVVMKKKSSDRIWTNSKEDLIRSLISSDVTFLKCKIRRLDWMTSNISSISNILWNQ